MKDNIGRKGLVLGIILLFVGIAVQPGIIADDVIESDNSELVKITIQICKGDGANDHTVMLSQEQAEELESLISITKTKLDAAKTLEETSDIFNDAVVSLHELGVLPKDMSIEDAKRLVNGMEQNPRIVKILERWFSRNQGNLDDDENILCLIAGHTDTTFFIGPSLIPSLILVLIIGAPILLLDNLLDLLDRLFDIHINLIPILMLTLIPIFIVFGGLNVLTWQFIPLAFGHIIKLGRMSSGGWISWPIPADGWINTIGLNGIKNWNDSFYGWVLGFTGIKICYPFMTHFYMGAALMMRDTW